MAASSFWLDGTWSHRCPRVERVPNAVAEQVEREHGEQQRRSGNAKNHQAVLKIGVAAAIISPQLACGGLMPTPRYESAASSRMFCGMSSVV